MQTSPNFQQLLNQFVADLERKQNEAKAEFAAKIKARANSVDVDWDLYYADVSTEAAAAKAYFDSRRAVQGAIL